MGTALEAGAPEDALIGHVVACVVANWKRLNRFIDAPHIPRGDLRPALQLRAIMVCAQLRDREFRARWCCCRVIFYSLFETAKLLGVDPARYVREAALADARGEVLLSFGPHRGQLNRAHLARAQAP